MISKYVKVFLVIALFVALPVSALSQTQTRDVEQIKEKVVKIIMDEVNNLDINKLIDKNIDAEWNILNPEKTIRELIEEVTNNILKDTSYINKLLSGYFPNTARAVGKEIVTRTLESDKFKEIMNDILIRTYTRVLEEVLEDVYIKMLSIPGKVIKENYGEEVARRYIEYIKNFVGDSNSGILERVLKENLSQNIHIKYGLAKKGFLGTVSTIIVVKVLEFAGKTRIGGQIARRLSLRIYERLFGQALKRLLPKIIRITSIVAIVSAVWDLTHVNENIRQIGETIENMDELYTTIKTNIKDAAKEYVIEFINKSANQMGEIMSEIYLDFKGQVKLNGGE